MAFYIRAARFRAPVTIAKQMSAANEENIAAKMTVNGRLRPHRTRISFMRLLAVNS